MKKALVLFSAVFILAFAVACSASEFHAAYIGENADDDALTYYGFFEVVEEMEDAKEIFGVQIPGTARKLSLVISGVIVCGFNIAKAEITTDTSRKTIHARLPRAEVLNIVTDVKNIRVYDQKTGLFTSDFSFADMNTLLKKSSR